MACQKSKMAFFFGLRLAAAVERKDYFVYHFSGLGTALFHT
jgi:hypothetical protein